MKLIGNIYKLVGRLSAILLIGVLSSLVGCASMSLDDHREAVKPKTITVDEFKSLKRAPRSFQKHFKVGLSYFTKDNRTELDLQTASVAFDTSWRLSRDYWLAAVYLGLSYEELGLYSQAMEAYIQAGRTYDHAAIWRSASVVALKAGYENLAYSLYMRAADSNKQSEDLLESYLEAAYSPRSRGDGLPQRNIRSLINDEWIEETIVCVADDDDDDDDESDDDNSDEDDDESDDDNSNDDDDYVTDSGDFSFSFDFDFDLDLDEGGSEVAASLTNSDQPVIDPCQNVNVVVDTYVIRRSVQQASSIGIDLLSALKLTFGATLYDFDKTTTQNDNVSATQWTTTSAADLTIPSITYALSIANDSSVYTSLEASPSVLLNLNEKSKIFEGTEVFIVSTSSQTSGQFEKEIGVSLEATANSFTENEANLTLDVNLSTVNTTASTSNFETLNTDKLESEVTGIFPYDKAVVVSAFSSLNLRTNDTGQTGLKDVPGAGRLFGVDSASATARDVLVVSIVRLVSGVQRAPQSIEKNLADSLGIEVPEEDFSRVGFVYDLPSTRILMNIFNDQVVELLRKNEMPVTP